MVSVTTSTPRALGSAVKVARTTTARPNLVTKRSSSAAGMADDLADSLLSPTKRARVQFKNEVEVRTTDEFDKPLDIVREEVSRALERHKLGDSAEYIQIKAAFHGSQSATSLSETSFRLRLLTALTANAGSLNRSCSDLVSAVLQSDWIAQDEEYVDIFRRLLIVLVSAHSQRIGEVLEMLVQKFTKPFSVTSVAPVMSRPEAQKRVHTIIRLILLQFPHNGPTALRAIVDSLYPATWDSTKAHVLYVHNLLKITVYAPELEAAILSVITGRLVNLDMQIQTDIEEIDDLDELLVADSPGDLDAFMDSLEDEDEDDDASDVASDVGTEGLQGTEEKAAAIRREIQRMDVLMDLAFEHYTSSSAPSLEAQERAFGFLESHFDAFLLPSFRSRHTQFLLFHIAQTTPELIDRFVGTCLIKAMDKAKNSHVRQSAAAYLASFVARGNHVPAQIVRDVFAYIGDELADLRIAYEPNCRGPDLQRYGTYYALVQALLYIFCFRWRDLETTPSDPGSPMSNYNSCIASEDPSRPAFISGIKDTLDQNILSPLNPLKVCSPVVVEEFAKVAHHVGILFLFPKIEINKRLRLVQMNVSALDRETALSARRDESLLQLDEYFPFDPYLLPRSKRWLQGDYRDFEGLPGQDEDDSDSKADGSDGDDDDDDAAVSENGSI